MTGLWVLLKKEIREQIKTYRLLITGGVFLFFGLSTPLLIKYMPEIMEAVGEGYVIDIPEPTPLLALQEYSSTIAQMGVLLVILLVMGAVASERSKGTAAMVLSKPVSHGAFISSKLIAISANLLVSLGLASIAAYTYTALLMGRVDLTDFIFLNLLLFIYLVAAAALTLLFSSLFRNQLAAGGLALGVIVAQAVLTQLPWVGDYIPASLLSWGMGLLDGSHPAAWGALAVSLVLIVSCLYFSRQSLRQREI